MTLYQFLGLDINSQANCIWQGKYVATREEENQLILLYYLEDFYAEVFYNTRENAITKIKGFRSRSHLVPYITLLGPQYK